MKFWHYLIFVAAVLMLVVSFFLPNAVASVTDAGRLDNLTMIDSKSISFESARELALAERIALIANLDTEILPLKTGNVMDLEAAKERINPELEKLFLYSPFQFDFSGYTVEEGAAELVIDDATVPPLSAIVWELVLSDESQNIVIVTLDDETGFILKLIYRLGNKDNSLIEQGRGTMDERYYSIARSLTEMMRKYYNLPITLADYQFSSSIAYYKATIYGGGRAIPMFGAVRATSFTLNERV